MNFARELSLTGVVHDNVHEIVSTLIIPAPATSYLASRTPHRGAGGRTDLHIAAQHNRSPIGELALLTFNKADRKHASGQASILRDGAPFAVLLLKCHHLIFGEHPGCLPAAHNILNRKLLYCCGMRVAECSVVIADIQDSAYIIFR